ncbi:hypothetical protein [Pedobacter arcticus]|uniref:hypothetical protein n=1 Tax=Pedobacter arcticus TaxID=752140 RepID=UPI0002D797B9|nr:hypothetical protein [Pedobacter arcticus]
MDLIQIERALQNRLGFNDMLIFAKLTASSKINCRDMMSLCIHKNPQIAFRASWVLDTVTVLDLDVFLVNLSVFLELYPTITNSSVQRCFTKIMMLLTASKLINTVGNEPDRFEECLSATFDWLLNPKTPVAVQSNALEVVFQLSPYYDWVLEELTVMLEEKLVSSSPALISRAKRLLKKIN